MGVQLLIVVVGLPSAHLANVRRGGVDHATPLALTSTHTHTHIRAHSPHNLSQDGRRIGWLSFHHYATGWRTGDIDNHWPRGGEAYHERPIPQDELGACGYFLQVRRGALFASNSLQRPPARPMWTVDGDGRVLARVI